MKFVPLVLITVLLLALVPLTSAEPMDENDRLQFADGLYARGMHELALKEYETFLRDFTNSPKADVVHYRMGECDRGLGKAADAESEFNFVYTNFPTSEFKFKAGFKRADLAAETNRNDEAIGMLRDLINQKAPDDIAAAALYRIGEICEKTGKNDDALTTFEQVRNRYPATAFYSYALLKLGQACGRDKAKQDQALEMFRLAAEKPANDRIAAEATFQMAEILFGKKAYDKSAEAYKKLLVQFPADQRAAESKLQAAWACQNAGLYVDALGIADEALKGDTGDKKAEWLYLKANCERQLMKNDAAIQTYSQLLNQYGSSRFANVARYEKALTFYKMGQFKETVAEADKISQTADLKKDVCWLLAESHAALKEDDLAIQFYRIITTEFPKSDVGCDAAYRLAHFLQGKKEYKEASRCYNIVAADFPDNKLAPRALYASGVCNAMDNQHAEALRDWAALIQKYPGDPLVEEAIYQKAMSEMRLKRFADATASLRDLLKKSASPRFAPDAHYWLGVMLDEDRKTQDSETELRTAAKDGAGKDWQKDAEFRLAIVLQKNGKEDESAVLFQSLLSSPERENFSPQLLEWLSEFKFGKKQYQESIDAAKLMVERAKDTNWLQIGWCLTGRGQLALGDKPAAEQAYRKAMALDVNTHLAPESALRLGELLLEGTNRADAAGFFSKAATLASGEQLLGVRARAYIGLGKTAKASSDFEAASRYFMSVAVLFDDPNVVPECLFEAAEAYKKLGRQDDAAKTIKELKDRYPQSEWAKKAQ